jgi:hypothetical protein
MERIEYLTRTVEFAARGNALPHAKLNPDLVRQIRINANGKTARQWSLELNVHKRTIEAVQSGKNWRHV